MVISTERNLIQRFPVGVAHPLFCYAFGSFFAPLQPDRYLSVVLCVRRKDTIMKKAVMSINTGAKAIDIIKKYTDNVIIRVSDFYPDSVGGQEYCEITKPVFFELLKYKAMDEGIDPTTVDPDNTPTVIIRVKDFYPRSGKKEEYREVSREEFNILMAINMPYAVGYSDCGTSYKVVVMTKDFYPFLCSEKEYTELDGKTYEMLVSFKAVEESDTKVAAEPDKDGFHNRGNDNDNSEYDQTNAAEIDGKITVRVRDFSPYIDSDDDYADIEWKTYVALLRIKACEEYIVTPDSDRDTTVKIRLRDFFPRVRLTKEYNEVSIFLYEELLRMKELSDPGYAVVNGDKVKIRLCDFYPEYHDEDEYTEVSRDVYNFLLDEKRRMKSSLRKQERYEYGWDIDYEKIGEMNGIYMDSAEDVFMENDLLRKVYAAMNQIKPELSRRYYLRYALGYSESKIAKMEKVSQPAVSMSIAKADKLIKEILREQGVIDSDV